MDGTEQRLPIASLPTLERRRSVQVLQHGPRPDAMDGGSGATDEHQRETPRRQRRRAAHEQPPEPQGGDRSARGQLHGVRGAGKGAPGEKPLRQRGNQGQVARLEQPAFLHVHSLAGKMGESAAHLGGVSVCEGRRRRGGVADCAGAVFDEHGIGAYDRRCGESDQETRGL